MPEPVASDAALEKCSCAPRLMAQVRVVDDQGNSLPERRVGTSVGHQQPDVTGYYERPDLNEKLF